MQEEDNPGSFVPTVENACKILEGAWGSVEPEMIQNCWKHAGFLNGKKKKTEPDVAVDSSLEIDPKDIFLWNTLNEK